MNGPFPISAPRARQRERERERRGDQVVVLVGVDDGVVTDVVAAAVACREAILSPLHCVHYTPPFSLLSLSFSLSPLSFDDFGTETNSQNQHQTNWLFGNQFSRKWERMKNRRKRREREERKSFLSKVLKLLIAAVDGGRDYLEVIKEV